MLSASDLLDGDARDPKIRKRRRNHLARLEQQPTESKARLVQDLLAVLSNHREGVLRRINAATVLAYAWPILGTSVSVDICDSFARIVHEEFPSPRIVALLRDRTTELIFLKMMISYTIRLRPKGTMGIPEAIRDGTRGTEFSLWIDKMVQRKRKLDLSVES